MSGTHGTEPAENGPLLELSAAQAVTQMTRGELKAERYAEALLTLGLSLERVFGRLPPPPLQPFAARL